MLHCYLECLRSCCQWYNSVKSCLFTRRLLVNRLNFANVGAFILISKACPRGHFVFIFILVSSSIHCRITNECRSDSDDCLFVCLTSVCLSICLFTCLFVHLFGPFPSVRPSNRGPFSVFLFVPLQFLYLRNRYIAKALGKLGNIQTLLRKHCFLPMFRHVSQGGQTLGNNVSGFPQQKSRLGNMKCF